MAVLIEPRQGAVMDSRLDSLFKNTFRQTERTDTWMGIRREEPRDDQRRKNDDHKDDEDKTVWEDNMAVSIASLRQFLLSLLESQAPDPQDKGAQTSEAPEEHPLTTTQQKTHKAINAYQTTARHSTPTPPPVAEAPVKPNPAALTQEENRDIYQLLQDLDNLLAQGITSLTIQKDGSFLQSLRKSAASALDQ